MLLALFRLQILSVYTSCQLTRAEESEVGATMVADRRVRCLPTGHKLEDGLRRSEGIGHVLERVEEDLRKNRECLNLNISDSHLNHEQDDEEEDEGGVEVGDVEGGAEPPDQCVPSDHHGSSIAASSGLKSATRLERRHPFKASFLFKWQLVSRGRTCADRESPAGFLFK